VTKDEKKLIASLVLVVAGIALVKWEDRVNRKKQEKRTQQIEALSRQAESIHSITEDISADLDKKLEAARFWEIVTRPEN